MTQNYIAGELSVLLGELRSLSGNERAAGRAAALRHEAETSPVHALRPVAARAVKFAEALCWESLEDGDISAFHRRAEALVDLYEFAVCSRLLPEAQAPVPPEAARSRLRPRR
jgi:hypothetical protein